MGHNPIKPVSWNDPSISFPRISWQSYSPQLNRSARLPLISPSPPPPPLHSSVCVAVGCDDSPCRTTVSTERCDIQWLSLLTETKEAKCVETQHRNRKHCHLLRTVKSWTMMFPHERRWQKNVIITESLSMSWVVWMWANKFPRCNPKSSVGFPFSQTFTYISLKASSLKVVILYPYDNSSCAMKGRSTRNKLLWNVSMEGCTVCMYLCVVFPPVIAPPCVADSPTVPPMLLCL